MYKLTKVISIVLLIFLVSLNIFAATNYVSKTGGHISPFNSWANAATNIQAAINVTSAGYTVLVNDGVYYPTNTILVTNSVMVKSVNGPEKTIVDGGNSNRCFFLNPVNAIIDGFTIRNGYAAIGPGGGVLCHINGIVRNCIIRENSADFGGGIVCEGGGSVQNCTIRGNFAKLYNGGGALCLQGGTIQNCLIIGNSATNFGGGVECFQEGSIQNSIISNNSARAGGGVICSDNAIVQNCTISGNSATQFDGGGAMCFQGATIQNCLITGNSATNNGGGVMCFRGGTIQNCTISDNSGISAGGVFSLENSNTVENCIIWGNTGFNLAGFIVTNHYNCIEGWTGGGEGNITDDPLFMSSADFHLLSESPCINTGTNLPYVYTTTDLDGYPRLMGGRVNMGCYEYDNLPVIKITNYPANVTYNITTVGISGENYNIAGILSWFIDDGVTNWDITPAANAWSASITDLNYGDNNVSVVGTNANGKWAIDSVNIHREIFDEVKPFIDITNAPVIVPYIYETSDISGTNVNIAGQLACVNDQHPETTNTFSPGFRTSVNKLVYGDNLIDVYGTNIYGHFTNDTITIHRETWQEIHPFVNITNIPPIVSYNDTAVNICGTNLNIAGKLVWVNNNYSGSSNYFSPGFLANVNNVLRGDNVITISGTNVYGYSTNDTITIHRETWEDIKPLIDITNAPAIVAYLDTTADISGTDLHISGELSWVNDRFTDSTNSFSQGFNTAITNIDAGDNIITIFGTNVYGHFTNDTVTIHSETWDEVKPFIGITNTPAIVPHPQTTAKISGTNVNIAGQLAWINNRNPENTNLFALGFATTINNLAEGNNLIEVLGTNMYGYFTNDFVNIYRETWEEVHPFIDITNITDVLLYFVTTAEISGTNLNITGQLAWMNDRSSQTTNLFAVGFSTTVNNLAEGNNLIKVLGTNIYGYFTNDTILINRQTYEDATPVNVIASDGDYSSNVQISWSASPGADKYHVYRNVSDLTSGFTQISGDISETNFTDSTITPGTIYYYRIKAGKDNLWSGFSISDSGYALFTAAPTEGWKYKDGKKFDILKGKDITPMLASNLIAGWQIGIASVAADGTLTNFNGPYSLENKRNKNKLWFLKKKKDIIIKYKYNEKKMKDSLLYKLWDQMPNSKVLYLIPANLASNQSAADIFNGKHFIGIELIEKEPQKTKGWRELMPVIIP